MHGWPTFFLIRPHLYMQPFSKVATYFDKAYFDGTSHVINNFALHTFYKNQRFPQSLTKEVNTEQAFLFEILVK